MQYPDSWQKNASGEAIKLCYHADNVWEKCVWNKNSNIPSSANAEEYIFCCMVQNIRNNWVIAANQAQTDERRRPSQSRSESRSPLLTVPANSKHACMWGGLLAVVAGAVKTLEFTAPCRFSSVNPWHAMQVRARRHLRPGLWKRWSLQTPEESPL